MGYTIAQKIIKNHLISGDMTVGSEIALKIDQTLTQDATGTMAYLEFETMGLKRVKTEKSVAYIDHNTLQSGFENADDHRYIQSVAKKTKCLLVHELNCGQYVREVGRAVQGMVPVHLYAKYDNEPATPEQLLEKIRESAEKIKGAK